MLQRSLPGSPAISHRRGSAHKPMTTARHRRALPHIRATRPGNQASVLRTKRCTRLRTVRLNARLAPFASQPGGRGGPIRAKTRVRYLPRIRGRFAQVFVLWWSEYGRRVASRVGVVRRLVDGQTETCLVIPKNNLERRGAAGAARYHITTTPSALLSTQFQDDDVDEIQGATYPKAKGRVIFCTDLVSGEVLAAVAYHFPTGRGERISIRRFAVRTDQLSEESFLCASMLKVYVHEFARRTKDDATLELECSAGEATIYCQRLGFKRDGVAASGRVRLAQAPFRVLP